MILKEIGKYLNMFFDWLEIKPESPCHNEKMESVDCHDVMGDMPIYECPKCKKRWI